MFVKVKDEDTQQFFYINPDHITYIQAHPQRGGYVSILEKRARISLDDSDFRLLVSHLETSGRVVRWL